MNTYYVYILASRRNGTLYVGVTNELSKRIYQHKNNLIPGFTKKYNVKILVYYEITKSIGPAIMREKQLKAGSRAKKIALIERMNPAWKELYETL